MASDLNATTRGPNTTLLFAGPEPVFAALKKVLSALTNWELCPPTAANPKCRIGVLAAWDDDELRCHLYVLLRAGCDSIIVIGGAECQFKIFDRHPSITSSAFHKIVRFAGVDLRQVIDHLNSASRPPDPLYPGDGHHLQRVLEGIQLYTLVRSYSHAGKEDITNNFLGPARLLLEDGVSLGDLLTSVNLAQARRTWNGSLSEVCKKIEKERAQCGFLGYSLLDACAKLEPLLNRGTAPALDASTVKGLIKTIMDIFTECRRLAAQDPHPEPRATEPKPPVPDPIYVDKDDACEDFFRILVVDDYADAWRPVLERVADHIVSQRAGRGTPCRIEVDFSLDARNVLTSSGRIKIYRCLAEYDLVLLDIYLGADENGLDILKKIRERCNRPPVLVWTTSTASDNPAGAAQANGFLFKKSVTVAELADAIDSWLSAGRSQRLWSLPNPFFDHVLRDPKLREVALAFTKWTLRYMDCFHAVDHFYFRYFNDHGGRHILGVLNVLEKLLRPFLFDDDMRCVQVLRSGVQDRARDLFCLYIATLCHEYGMFPILHTDPTFPPGRSADKEKQKAVEGMRAIHGLRGMAMLSVGFMSNDALPPVDAYRVSGLEGYLDLLKQRVGQDDGKATLASVAVLVGYHQRLLSLKRAGVNEFLELNDTMERACEKIQGANSKLGESALRPHTIKVVLDEAKRVIPPGRHEMLRRQCALLRFADALDVDETRAPADFLLEDRSERRPMQDVEDCKRQVVASCEIELGLVTVAFCSPEPVEEMLPELLRLCRESIPHHKRLAKEESLTEQIGELNELCAWLNKEQRRLGSLFRDCKNAWETSGTAIADYLDCKDTKRIEAALSHAVAGYFVYCRSCARKGESNGRSSGSWLKTVQGSVAAAAALLVLLEILSEYRAIVEVDLQDLVRLCPKPNWGVRTALPPILNTALPSWVAELLQVT